MPRYKIKCKIEAICGNKETYLPTWYPVAHKEFCSEIFDYFNDIKKNERIRFIFKNQEINERVEDVYHDLNKDCAVLDLGTKLVQDESSVEKVKQEFDELVKKYSILEIL